MKCEKQYKQNGNRRVDTESRLVVATGDGAWGLGEKGEGIEKYRSAVTKYSRGCKVQRRE